ncbi:hypothetical protein EXIGLDRAFT_736750 [Exidia glandulosa HHB12029]|uniref:Uncharacterized protein n=1 Tax=Exidia glandulosa HHB12029 TaxID=1314781 RepID=A0A165PDM5_EXIGL|nr:hypothetical protein EXIGLDRAFT_736750 [Exidia glandulosa HHB12029]
MTTTRNALVFLALVSSAHASCYIDAFGRRRCSGISTAARAGIAVAFAVGAMLLLCLFGLMRRRAVQRRNMAFIARPAVSAPQASFHAQAPYGQHPYGQQQPYPAQYTAGYDPTNAGGPQYPQPPPQAYNGHPKPGGNDVENPPPPAYPAYQPPAGPPPRN